MAVSSKLFTHSAEDKIFSAEISTLLANGGGFMQVYVDSADQGLTMFSAKSGKESRWVVEHEEIDHEGELNFWELIPTPETAKHIPALLGYKMVVFND